MKDLISREALIQQIGEKLNVLRSCNDFKEAWGMRYAMVMIQNAPAVDAVEVVHGRCKFCEDYDKMMEIVCYIPTNNGGAIDIPVKHCPFCGARMDGE